MEEVKVETPKTPSKWNLASRVKDPSFKIASKGKWYAIAPAVILFIGIIVFAVMNFNLGLDFTGGQTIAVEGGAWTSANVAEYENRVFEIVNRELRASDNWGGQSISTWQEDRDGQIRITVQFQTIGDEVYMADITEAIRLAIQNDNEMGNVIARDTDFVSAATGSDHIQTMFIALSVALMGILLYMLLRFKFTSGIAALIGLVHDVLVMTALVVMFRIQINAAFIAAMITVVAYSINNTLILFDRIRGLEKHNEMRESVEVLTDRAVKETFVRTMNTMITTLVPVLTLIIASIPLGVPLLREFAIPIFFGLVAGTFSTIFLTTSLYVRFEKYRGVMRKRKKQKATT